MASTEDLTWLVEQRSKNQTFLLDLCTFGKTNEEHLIQDSDSRTAFQFLVGAAFSLWRAVFLAESETDSKVLLDQSTKFLETLVADNAIGYYQDKSMKAWTAGYYLNNAYFRLAEVIDTLGPFGVSGQGGSVPTEFVQFLEFDQGSMVSSDRQRAWDVAHAAASQALVVLRERVNSA
jgi:hypothetical protein